MQADLHSSRPRLCHSVWLLQRVSRLSLPQKGEVMKLVVFLCLACLECLADPQTEEILRGRIADLRARLESKCGVCPEGPRCPICPQPQAINIKQICNGGQAKPAKHYYQIQNTPTIIMPPEESSGDAI